MRGIELEREAKHWMLLSVATLVFCGSCLSAASVVLFYLAAIDAKHGALPEAALRVVWGKRIMLAGVMLGALGVFLALVVRVVSLSGR